MATPRRRFSYSDHAERMLVERGLERGWVERTLLSPDIVELDPKHADRLRVYGIVPERDGRVLRVVYVAAGPIYRVITLFLDRGRRR